MEDKLVGGSEIRRSCLKYCKQEGGSFSIEKKMPPKKRAPKGMAKPLPPGQILIDLRKNQWKLGPLIGQGGFGYLYLGE